MRYRRETLKAQLTIRPKGYRVRLSAAAEKDSKDDDAAPPSECILADDLRIPVVCKVPKLGAGADDW